MAACTFTRLDSRNNSTTSAKYASRLIRDADTSSIMVAWIDQGKSGGSDPQSIRFGRYNSETNVASAETPIRADYTYNNTTRAIDMVQLDDGRLIAAWHNGATAIPWASESTDGGVTWSTAAAISADVNRQIVSLQTDGTTVWIITTTTSGTLSFGDLNAYKRTAANTWAAAVKIYEGNGQTGTPGAMSWSSAEQLNICGDMVSGTHGWMVSWRCVDGTNQDRKLTCIWTTDGWATDATANVVDLHTYTAEGQGNINVLVHSSGRIYLQAHNPDVSDFMVLYYSDNGGLAWTLIGSPTVYTTRMAALGESGNRTYDSFLCFDEFENLLFGQSTGLSPNPGYHLVFRSGTDPTSLADWVQVGECTYDQTVNVIQAQTCGRAIVIGSDLERLAGMTRTAVPDYYTLEFLDVEDAGWIPEPETPELPLTPASGATDSNIYLRNDVALPGTGYSAHLFPVAYFMDWDEGDAETGREVGLILAASPSMDPATQDPALIAGFSRISDPGSYTSRTYSSDGESIQTTGDPLLFRVTTPQYTITKEFNRNVARGALIAWTLTGDSAPTVTVLVDGRAMQTIRLYNTYGLKKERFFPFLTFNNVGSEIQYVIEDLSPFFFAIETLGVKYKDKKIRGESRG